MKRKQVVYQPADARNAHGGSDFREQLFCGVGATGEAGKESLCSVYLGMTVKEIAKTEGVDLSRVYDSINAV